MTAENGFGCGNGKNGPEGLKLNISKGPVSRPFLSDLTVQIVSSALVPFYASRFLIIKLVQQPFQSVDLLDPVVGSQRNEIHGN